MTDPGTAPDPAAGAPAPPAGLPAAARRALAEAEARRAAAAAAAATATAPATALPPELGGRDGPEPVRFGDWERRGIAVDF